MTPLGQIPRAEEFINLLRGRVAVRTLRHCVSTTEYMLSYAGQLGLAEDRVAAAGLLHDLCKRLDGAAMLKTAEAYGIAPNEAQRLNPGLLHGPVAAEECRRSLGIEDDEVYEAIYWHTTGRPGLRPLGLSVYFSDFVEPLRAFPEAVAGRRLLEGRGFYPALRYVAEQKLVHVHTKRYVDPMTEAFHAWLKETGPA